MSHSQAVKACTLLTFSRWGNSTPCMDCLQVNIISYQHKIYRNLQYCGIAKYPGQSNTKDAFICPASTCNI